MTDLYHFSRYYFHELGVFYFIFGACIGSFLNVCIWRIPRGESIVTPGSYCPSCKRPIKASENIPIVSWLLLRGKCSRCHTPISLRYAIIESMTGIFFLFIWYRVFIKCWPLSLLIPFSFIIASSIVIVFVDFSYFIIPNVITFTGFGLAIIWGIAFPVTHQYDMLNVIFYGLMQHLLIGLVPIQETEQFGYLFSRPLILTIFDMILGILFGGGTLLLLNRLGKLIWGIKKTTKKIANKLTISENGFQIENKPTAPWNQLFKSNNDTFKIYGKLKGVTTKDQRPIPSFYTDIFGKEKEFIITKGKILILSREIALDKVNFVIESRRWILCREVMGMGDVKLMVMLGGFLGPVGALFILFLSSVIGTIFGLIKGVISTTLYSREWESRIPLGPFIAFAAMTYIFCGEELIYCLFPILFS